MSSDRFGQLLEFIAAHEVVAMAQAEEWLGVEPGAVVADLERMLVSGWIERVRFADGFAALYRVTPAGQQLVDPLLPELDELQVGSIRHDLAVTWISVAARDGMFGKPRRVLSRRQMIAAERAGQTAELFGHDGPRSLGRVLERGGEVIYPDVVFFFENPARESVPIHVVLSPVDRSWWVRLLSAYASDRFVEAVVVLAGTKDLCDAVREVAVQAGVLMHGEGDRALAKVTVREIAPLGIKLAEGQLI